MATITAIRPEGRFGVMDINDENMVAGFREKHKVDVGWINGGFMVLEPEVIDMIEDDTTIFERKPLEELSKSGNLAAFKHTGFWQCMDTQRDKQYLENLVNQGKAPWINWKID